jgi:mannose-1-phosphate guanylyltransferase / mannose-6-phosphate isomerase
VILAGGAGTRLWPVSRETLPKHLARLVGDETLLQQAARRVIALAPPDHVITVGAKAQDFLVARQLAEVDPALARHRLVEPTARNTAAAIALAALYARRQIDPEAVLWVCPSDHLMRDATVLEHAIATALPVAYVGTLVTFSITPTRPETACGYVCAAQPLPEADRVLKVTRFVEKPACAAAEAMLSARDHFWNSGMFLFRADRILAEVERHARAFLRAVEAAFASLSELPGGAWQVPLELYERVPAQPIDKAIMEQAERIALVSCDPGWSALGSWQALWEQQPRDASGNAVRGDVVLDEAHDCLIQADSAPGRLLWRARSRGDRDRRCDPRHRSHPLRGDPAAGGDAEGAWPPRGSAHGEEHRPWGSFSVLHDGPGFKVKEMSSHPAGASACRVNRHRAEHRVVVAGIARITVDDEVPTLAPNQSVHIPLGSRHRMENPGEQPMHLIEVQCGRYLGEYDIIRYDIYGRS